MVLRVITGMPKHRNLDEEPFIQLHDSAESMNVNSVNMTDSVSTVIHCHDLRPVTSNTKAWKKLIIASTFCLLFAIGEAFGK